MLTKRTFFTLLFVLLLWSGVSAETPQTNGTRATPILFDDTRYPDDLTTYGQQLFVASSTDCAGGEFPPVCRIYRRHVDSDGGIDIHINTSGTTNQVESSIASDDTHTYFQGNFGTISRVLNFYHASTPESYFATKENAATTGMVAVDDHYVYWTENLSDSGKLFRASKSTGTRELMFDSEDYPIFDMQVDSSGRVYVRTNVFAVFCCVNIIARVAPNGGSFTVTYSGIVDVHDFVLSDTTIYAAHDETSGSSTVAVRSASVNNFDDAEDWTTLTTISGSQGVRKMLLSDSALFWQQTTSTNTGPIKRMPLATNTPVSISTSINIGDMVRIDDHLYFRYVGDIYKLAIDAEAIANDLDADDVQLEVLQAMQNATHTVPLIEGRRTFVRAYGRIGSSSEGLTEVTLSPGMVLHGTRNGEVLEGSPLRPIKNPAFTPATIDRTTMDTTWLFELPQSWTEGTVALTAIANEARLFDETTHDNNSTNRTVSFNPVRGLCLDMLSVSTQSGNSITNGSSLRRHLERGYTLLPVNEFGSVWRGGPARTRPVTGAPYNMSDTGEKISLMLDLTFEFMFSGPPPHCGDWHTVRTIMVTDSDRLGMSNPVAPFIYFLEDYGGAPENFPWGGTAGVAHELGHQLQGGHVNCPMSGDGSPDFPYTTLPYPTQCHIDHTNNHIGYDPLSDTLIVPLDGSNQPLYNDVMSYGDPNWTSELVYRRMYDTLKLSRATQPAARTVTAPKQIAGGYIAPDGTTHLDAIFEVDSATATHMQTLIGDMESSDYVLRVTDAANVTTDVPLLIEDHFGDSEGGLVFFALFDPIANIEQAEVVESSTSSVLATKTADGQAPTVTILEPTTGSTVSGDSMTISWQGSQTRSDALLYRVFYSGDGGNGWYEVATTDVTSITVDTATLPGGTNGLLRVYVSDGLNSSFTDATGLTLPNSAPFVTITPRSMTGGGIAGDDSGGIINFPAGSAVEFGATAFDLEDGPLDDATFNWVADGFIDASDTGATFFKENLQPGIYTLRMTVVDSHGLAGEGSMQFRILPKQVNDQAGVVLDGYCDDLGYSADLNPLSLISPDDNAQLRMVRSGGDYYICFGNMNQAYADEYVDLRLDPDNSQDSTMQGNDLYVRLYRDGRFEHGVGTGSGGTMAATPSALYAGMVTENDDGATWQAEIRIDGSVLPVWDSLIGASFRHKYSSLSFGVATWPSSSLIGGPNRWGEVALGDAIVPTVITVQSSAAQPALTSLSVIPLLMVAMLLCWLGVWLASQQVLRRKS